MCKSSKLWKLLFKQIILMRNGCAKATGIFVVLVMTGPVEAMPT